MTSCFEAKDSELIGQVKKVINNTPIVCPDYVDADISLGILRNGVGSMSSEDVWVYVPEKNHQDILKQAAESGALVKITYNTRRFTFCMPSKIITAVIEIK